MESFGSVRLEGHHPGIKEDPNGNTLPNARLFLGGGGGGEVYVCVRRGWLTDVREFQAELYKASNPPFFQLPLPQIAHP